MNNLATRVLLSIENKEAEAIAVRMIGGSLWLPDRSDVSYRNLSSASVNVVVPPGEVASTEYKFVLDLHPQDLRLMMAAVVEHPAGKFHQVTAHNATVSVVEAPISLFDPQMYALHSEPFAVSADTDRSVVSSSICSLAPSSAAPATSSTAPG